MLFLYLDFYTPNLSANPHNPSTVITFLHHHLMYFLKCNFVFNILIVFLYLNYSLTICFYGTSQLPRHNSHPPASHGSVRSGGMISAPIFIDAAMPNLTVVISRVRGVVGQHVFFFGGGGVFGLASCLLVSIDCCEF